MSARVSERKPHHGDVEDGGYSPHSKLLQINAESNNSTEDQIGGISFRAKNKGTCKIKSEMKEPEKNISRILNFLSEGSLNTHCGIMYITTSCVSENEILFESR